MLLLASAFWQEGITTKTIPFGLPTNYSQRALIIQSPAGGKFIAFLNMPNKLLAHWQK
jgi:transcription termination factor Rho